MLTASETRLALLGACALVIHTVATALALVPDIHVVVHLISAVLYLVGYLAFAAAFRRRAKWQSILFALCISVGIVGGILLDAVRFGEQRYTSFDYALPISFLFFAFVLFWQQNLILKIVGTLYAGGAASWFIATVWEETQRISSPARFFAEFLGMNATIILIVWAFWQASRLRLRESSEEVSS